MIYINKGFKTKNIEVVPHAIIDKEHTLIPADIALKIIDEVIMKNGIVDFDGGIAITK